MKNRFLIIASFLLLQSAMFAQAIGYQGKKFMAELGYSPVSNLSAKYFSYGLADDYYDDANDPILFKHLIKVNLEYTVFNSGSLVFRYNPFNYTSNINYYSTATDITDLVGIESKGNMFAFGYKSYTTPTAAPLGKYFGFYVTRYSYSTALVQSEFSRNSVPEPLANFKWDKVSSIGLSVSYGVKTIFYDKLTMDISLEAGYFFDNAVSSVNFDNALLGAEYQFVSDAYPQQTTLINTRAFFFAVPTIAFGYLAF